MTSLEGCTKRSGCNPGHSPGLQRAGNCLEDSTLMCLYGWRGTALQAPI